nr:MAG TPA: hypothetical protein [Caudoviricetes sp.]DAV46779.1 MAG TPA: hypothetical protein [Caudoviricetes sp.]
MSPCAVSGLTLLFLQISARYPIFPVTIIDKIFTLCYSKGANQ